MRYVIYARVSTLNNGQNPEMQINDLKEYAASRGFKIVKEYKDIASGAKESRPALNELMNDARKRLFDGVLVWRFDRFARSTKHLVSALDEFQSLGISFISYQENIDLSSSLGKAMFTIISAMSQLERDIIAERVISGLREAKRKGKVLGRPKVRDDNQIQILRLKGCTYKQIQEKLGISKGAVCRALCR